MDTTNYVIAGFTTIHLKSGFLELVKTIDYRIVHFIIVRIEKMLWRAKIRRD